ncbi:MAG: DNA primase [Rikenellaceae bacterium]
MIDRETVDRIYAAADIVDIISDYVTLKRKGVNYQACCPFHNEKTPSFVVSPSKGLFRCFGCGKGGNAITFIMQHESMSYPEALKVVAKKYGIEVKEREMSEEEVQRNDNRESMFALNGWAAEYFSNFLTHEGEGISVGLSYFRQSRGFSDKTIKQFGLGFCPAKGDTMSLAAKSAGYKAEFLTSTGLSIERESDHSLYDRFRDRVIFPVHNISGRIVAFGGRTLRTDKKVAKYQNSPESEIYSKKRELYGLYFAKKAIQQHNVVIMVEGYTDVISMHQAGIENVVSSSGTSLTVDQVRLLSRFTKNITVIYDGDAAGIKAAIRGIDIILREGMNVRVVSLPAEHDPDSFARSHTADEVQEYIRSHEEDFLTYKAKMLLGEAKGDPIKRAEMIGDMVESICQIPDQIRRAVFAKECSRIMEIDESVLLSEIGRKVAMGVGDAQTSEFLRNQSRRNGGYNTNNTYRSGSAPTPPPDDLFVDDGYLDAPKPKAVVPSLEAGSSVEVLEVELLKYLLKYGHKSVDIIQGAQVNSYNVASLIFEELEDGGMSFHNATNSSILQLYREKWEALGEGVEVPTSVFLEVDDVDVCTRTVDILTAGDNYVQSQLWQQARHSRGDNEEEILSTGVTRSLLLYKSKSLEGMLKDLQQELAQPNLTEGKQIDIVQRLSKLNAIKVMIAHQLKRVVI